MSMLGTWIGHALEKIRVVVVLGIIFPCEPSERAPSHQGKGVVVLIHLQSGSGMTTAVAGPAGICSQTQ